MAILAGGVRSQSGKTQNFSVEKDALNTIRALIFGRYGTREGRQYIKEKFGENGIYELIFGKNAGTFHIPFMRKKPTGTPDVNLGPALNMDRINLGPDIRL